ncbi:SAV0927 family protein [Lentibacillus sp. Marseille-P4043]|uniref:SAV0927 family protein n=1 Tax=Lentibacillus sp. Marseille-P4043 TaxID=2040293 RepID=UPI000D0B3B6B|nr:SAV0927 family protein [Lentibacillus sp. Marseille-P4043]
MSTNFDYLRDETIEKQVRYVSFMGKFHRYDFAFIDDKDDPKKKIVIDLRKNHFSILSRQDIEKPGEMEHVFHVTEMEADELRIFLMEIFQSQN